MLPLRSKWIPAVNMDLNDSAALEEWKKVLGADRVLQAIKPESLLPYNPLTASARLFNESRLEANEDQAIKLSPVHGLAPG
jgi:hypothetical protein